jgi:hypothetical protein
MRAPLRRTSKTSHAPITTSVMSLPRAELAQRCSKPLQLPKSRWKRAL